MSGLQPAYRKAGPCYGMTGRFGAGFDQPHHRCARTHAARMRATGNAPMSKLWFPTALIAALIAVSVPAMAQGKVPLADEAHINDQLIAAQAGDMLRQTCPTLSARMFVVLGKMQQLESYARSKGYTEAEVKAFLKDKSEKARIKVAAKAYLTAAGVVTGDADSYCAAGRAEIAKGTLVGSILRSSE